MIKQYYKRYISIVGTLAILMSMAFVLTGYAGQRGDKQSADTNTTRPVRFLFKNNNLDYQPIGTRTKFYNKDFKLTLLGLAKDDTFLYIKLVYVSPIKSRVGVRLAGDAPGLKKFLSYGTKIGRNLLIIQLETKKVLAYPASICVEIGDDHSVEIDKKTVDDFITGTSETSGRLSILERFSFKDNDLDYQPISTRTEFYNKGFKLPFLGLAKDEAYLYIKLVYMSPIQSRVGVRLAGDKDISDAHGLSSEFLTYGTEIGENLLIVKLKAKKVLAYPTHICVEIGDDHSVVIDKEIVDTFISGRRPFAVKIDIVRTFKTDTRKSIRFLFKDNNLDYQPISTRTKFRNQDFKLSFLGLARDDNNTHLYIKLVYISPIKSPVGIRLAGDKDVSDAFDAWKFLPQGTKIGKNLLIIELETKRVARYPTHICVEIGDDHSVQIDKDIVDDFITDTPESIRFFFRDNNLDYQPIRTPTAFENKDFKLTFMGLAKDDTHLYIKLEYDSPVKSSAGIRLAGDKDISDVFDAWKFLPEGTKIGKNLFIIQLVTKKVAKFPMDICVEIGDEHSVQIEKDIVDAFLTGN